MGAKDDGPEAKRARAEAAFAKQLARDAMASEREHKEAERIKALDDKTARLRAARLARDAEGAARKSRR